MMTSTTARLRSAATLAAAGALLAAFTPASAKTNANSEPTERQATEGASTRVEPAAEKKYCIKDKLTGSHRTQTFCKTREQWSNAGVEIPAEK